jgi:hypothetical protein
MMNLLAMVFSFHSEPISIIISSHFFILHKNLPSVIVSQPQSTDRLKLGLYRYVPKVLQTLLVWIQTTMELKILGTKLICIYHMQVFFLSLFPNNIV